MLIDTHCHLNSLSKPAQELAIAKLESGCYLIDSSIDLESSEISLKLSQKYPLVYSSLGFHPFSAKKFSIGLIENYQKLINQNKKVVAIGEIGLDYKADLEIKQQVEAFRQFLKLAKLNNLVVMIHMRFKPEEPESQGRVLVLNILDEFFPSYGRVVFHCFSSSENFLQEIIKRKGNLSFSLNVLRKNKVILDSLVKCPLENLLLETDSPYMRIGQAQSTPLDIEKVYQRVAELRNIDLSELEAAVFANAKRVFNLKS